LKENKHLARRVSVIRTGNAASVRTPPACFTGTLARRATVRRLAACFTDRSARRRRAYRSVFRIATQNFFCTTDNLRNAVFISGANHDADLSRARDSFEMNKRF